MKRIIYPLCSNNRKSTNNSNDHDLSVVSVRLPGSKYIANRLLPLCALASSDTVLSNIVDNDDINAATQGLSALGYQFRKIEGDLVVNPRNTSDIDISKSVDFNTHHSGTFSRFVTAIAALEARPVTINCSDKMATRPMNELFDYGRPASITFVTLIDLDAELVELFKSLGI